MAIHLRRTDENTDDIEAAVARFGPRVGVEGVLDDLNRQAQVTKVPGRAVERGFRWNDSDARTRRWWPQGITTSADAGDRDDGRELLITSWYARSKKGDAASRISVIDLETLTYRHVLLVLPERDDDGDVRLRRLRVHAGGLVWCGPYLHVAGTRRGLFSCRVDDLIRLHSTDDAFGYRYALPVRFAYDAAAEEGVERMRYSFLSLDRGADPPELVAGEYARDDMTRRLVRYPLDPETLHLAAGEDGTSQPAWIDERGLGHMQGVALVGNTFYVTASRGAFTPGNLHVGEPGSWHTMRGVLPIGPEDITYWPDTDRLWSLSEYPGNRYVFSMVRSKLG